jgi:hypothetical protein
VSKNSRRKARRGRRERFVRRLVKAAPFGCITCAFEALASDGSFLCATHGPLTGDQKEGWRRAHPGYAKAADAEQRALDAYMERNGRARPKTT